MFTAVIIGCGKIAGNANGAGTGAIQSHARAYACAAGIALADCIDIDLAKARELAREHHCKSFGTDFIASINRVKPDVVSICTSDQTHFAVARKILANKVVPAVIFLEKPACANMAEFSRLKTLARQRGVLVVVNHSRRFHDAYKKIRDLIRRRVFGAPVRLDVFYYGGFRHNGVHVIDTLLYLFGDTLRKRGVGRRIMTQYPGDPTLDLAFVFTGSGAGVHLHGVDEKYYQLFDLDLKFEKARLRIENFEGKFILEKKHVNATGENVLVNVPFGWKQNGTPFKNAVDAIVRFLRTGDRAAIDDYTLERAEDTMRVMGEAGKK